MFPIARSNVRCSILVSDGEIREAQLRLWETLRIVVEPGGATAFAPLLSGRYQPSPGEKIAILLCGGNTGVAAFT
jgi:threonine dehydratase